MRIRWASLPEFGPITSVRIFAGSTAATSLLLAFDPTLSGEGYLGSSQLDLRDSHLHGPHYFRVECLTSDGDAGHRAYANPIWVDFSTTADVVDGWAPVSVAPPRVAPDPSSGTIRIEFALTKGASVGCTIHDAAGRRVRRLSEGQRFSAGGHKVEWDGRDDRGGAVPSGVYYGVLTLDGVQSVHKLHLIR
jgi:hypothetical protein